MATKTTTYTTYTLPDGSTATTETRELLIRVKLDASAVQPVSVTTVTVREANGRTVIDEYTNWADTHTGKPIRQVLTRSVRH